jgi:transcription elongation factor Elf1
VTLRPEEVKITMETDCLFCDARPRAEEMVVALNKTTTINCRLCGVRSEAEETVVALKITTETVCELPAEPDRILNKLIIMF